MSGQQSSAASSQTQCVEGDKEFRTAVLLDAGQGIGSLHLFLDCSQDQTMGSPPGVPVVTLGRRGGAAWVLEAGLFDSDQGLIGRYALKIQPHTSVAGHLARAMTEDRARDAARTNASLDRWCRERAEAVRRYGASPSGRPRQVALAGLNGLDSGRLGPRLYCTLRERLFRPRCPETLAPLIDCRDDELLSSLSLPLYGESNVRFLYAPVPNAGAAPRFYTEASQQFDDSPAAVGGEEELFRDQGKILEALDDPARNPIEREEIRREFPCYECSEAQRCYPSDEKYAQVVDRLVALNFHDVHVVCTELFDLQMDEYCDLVGGRPIGPWLDQLQGSPDGCSNRHLVGVLEQLAGMPCRIRFSGDPRGSLVEILFLKWSMLTRTIERLRALYGECRRPHLHLSARHVVIRMNTQSRFSPALWDVEVGLLGLDGALPFEAEGSSLRGLHRAPLAPEPLYAAMDMVNSKSEFGRRYRGSVHVAEVIPAEGQPDAHNVRGRFVASPSSPLHCHAGDALHLHLPGAGETQTLSIWVRVERVGETDGVAFSGLVRGENDLRRLEELVDQPLSEAEHEYYPRYGLANDLYAVGVLLWQALLVNQDQELAVVTTRANQVLSDLQTSADQTSAVKRLAHWASNAWQTPEWHPRNLCHQPVPNENQANSPIPRRIWEQILCLGLRLLAGSESLGLVARDCYPSDEAAILDDLLDSFVSLQRELERQLFSVEQKVEPAGTVLAAMLGNAEIEAQEGGHG